MKRVWLPWISIGQSKVNSDIQINLTAAEHIFQKVGASHQFEFDHLNNLAFELHLLDTINKLLNRGMSRTEYLMITISR